MVSFKALGVLGAALAMCSGASADLIVGGEDAAPADYPWMVSLGRSGSHFCGGALIAPGVVVTAAHCTVYSASQISVRVKGTGLLSSGSETFGVTSIIDHPSYTSSGYSNDIAILLLDGESGVPPVTFDTGSGSPTEHTDALSKCIGWGALREGGSSPTNLQQVDLPIVSNTECANRSYGSQLTDSMICAGRPSGGIDACQGDSGGPIFIETDNGPLLIGVVSWGRGCAREDYYGVYARVAYLKEFVLKYAQPSTPGDKTRSPTKAITPAPTLPPVTTPVCECDNGNGRFEICDQWYQSYKPTSDPLYNTYVCLLNYSGGQSNPPSCTVPTDAGELIFSTNLQRWYMNGCLPSRNVFVEELEWNDVTLTSDDKPAIKVVEPNKTPEATSTADLLPVVAGVTVGTALVVGLAAFTAHKKVLASKTKDTFGSFSVSNSQA